MRLAILGTDPDVLALVAAAVSQGHAVVWLADLRDQDAPEFRQSVPAINPEVEWESVLDHDLADAVIVGAGTGGEEQRLERLRRLVADGIATLSTHPISTSVLPYFELDMVRHEVGGVLRHWNPVVDRSAAARIAEWLREGHHEIGRIRQVAWERRLESFDETTVFTAMARDAEAILDLVERITKVSAFGSKQGEDTYGSFNVQMNSSQDVVVTWALAPADVSAHARITLIGERGKLDVLLSETNGCTGWNATAPSSEHPSDASLGSGDQAGVAIEQLADSVAAEDAAAAQRSTWQEATRAMELVDAVQLSLQRGRTIEIMHQKLTEQLAFRGVMSALGCGLLLMGMFVLVLVSILGGTVGISFFAWWPIALGGVLLVFLLLQLVPLTRRH